MEKIITEKRCEHWLRRFLRHVLDGRNLTGIEVECFWKAAADAHVYEPGTVGDGCPMSKVLPAYVKEVETVTDRDGNYIYSAFRFF